MHVEDLAYEDVGPEHHEFLYQLLKERPKNASISHKVMPTWEQHVSFVNSVPYKEWFVIRWKGQMAGSCYITKHNEYGMFIKREFQRRGIARAAFCWIRRRYRGERLLSNINPQNTPIKKLLKSLGCKLIQETYEHA